jgi:hypothetical protein
MTVRDDERRHAGGVAMNHQEARPEPAARAHAEELGEVRIVGPGGGRLERGLEPRRRGHANDRRDVPQVRLAGDPLVAARRCFWLLDATSGGDGEEGQDTGSGDATKRDHWG